MSAAWLIKSTCTIHDPKTVIILAEGQPNRDTSKVSARDLLHRLVDDLDDEDAALAASLASPDSMDRAEADNGLDIYLSHTQGTIIATQAKLIRNASRSGEWPDGAQRALQAFIQNAISEPGRETVLALILLAKPPEEVRNQILRAILAIDTGHGIAGASPGHSRTEAIADALGSLKAEGLEPTSRARMDAAAYEAGQMTAGELYIAALDRAQAAREK